MVCYGSIELFSFRQLYDKFFCLDLEENENSRKVKTKYVYITLKMYVFGVNLEYRYVMLWICILQCKAHITQYVHNYT
jgi:hypothetical protein